MHTVLVAAGAVVMAASRVSAAPAERAWEHRPSSATLVNHCPVTATLYSRYDVLGSPDVFALSPGQDVSQVLGNSLMWEIYSTKKGSVNFDYSYYTVGDGAAKRNASNSKAPGNLFSFYTTETYPFGGHVVTLGHSNPECINHTLDKPNRWDEYCEYNSSVVITLCADLQPPQSHELQQQPSAPTRLPTHRKHKPWAGTRLHPPNLPPARPLAPRAAPGQMMSPRSAAPSEPAATWPVTWDPNGAQFAPDARASKASWPLQWDPMGPEETPDAAPRAAKRQDFSLAGYCRPFAPKTYEGRVITLAPWCPPQTPKTLHPTPQTIDPLESPYPHPTPQTVDPRYPFPSTSTYSSVWPGVTADFIKRQEDSAKIGVWCSDFTPITVDGRVISEDPSCPLKTKKTFYPPPTPQTIEPAKTRYRHPHRHTIELPRVTSASASTFTFSSTYGRKEHHDWRTLSTATAWRVGPGNATILPIYPPQSTRAYAVLAGPGPVIAPLPPVQAAHVVE